MKQKMPQIKQSVSKRVTEMLEADPYARQAIRLGIANYSAIAARIKRDRLPGASIAAIKAAITRYAPTLVDYDYYHDLREVLAGTACALRNNVAVLTLFKGTRLSIAQITQRTEGDFSLITSHNGMTLIVNDEDARALVKLIGRGNIRIAARNLSSVILTSPPEIKETYGFVAYVAELLARNGLNITEFYSCYRDTVFVMERKDAVRAYELIEKNTTVGEGKQV